jgi:branched-chain amino acid transport system permease protein
MRTALANWLARIRDERQQRRVALFAVAVVLVLFFPQINKALGLGLASASIPIGLFIVLALGLNVVVGFAGLLDLGYAAFFAIGAYASAFLTSPVSPIPYVQEHPVNFFIAMAVSTMVAALFGVVLGAPTLRLRGDYLAIVTLGFGEIVPLVVKNIPDITQGTKGMNPIGTPELPFVKFGFDTGPWYYLILGVVLLSVLLTSRLRSSRIGRAWMAIREDEVAAASMGINPVTTKLFAFALGASFSGFAGSIWASYLQVIAPEQFDFSVSIFVLAMIILGGMGNIWGVIAGGLLLGGFDRILALRISDVLHALGNAFSVSALQELDISKSRTFIFGLALVIMMLIRPEGLFPSTRRKMELHAAEESDIEAAQQNARVVDVDS